MGIWTLLLQAHTIQPSPGMGMKPFTVAPQHTHSVLTISSTGMESSSYVFEHWFLLSLVEAFDMVQMKKKKKDNIKQMVKIDLCVTIHKRYSLSIKESSFIDNIIFHVFILIALFCFC